MHAVKRCKIQTLLKVYWRWSLSYTYSQIGPGLLRRIFKYKSRWISTLYLWLLYLHHCCILKVHSDWRRLLVCILNGTHVITTILSVIRYFITLNIILFLIVLTDCWSILSTNSWPRECNVNNAATQGSSVYLDCEATNAPDRKATWWKMNQNNYSCFAPAPGKLKNTVLHENFTLELRNVSREDDGTYLCIYLGDAVASVCVSVIGKHHRFQFFGT